MPAAARARQKVSVTLDPDLLEAVDSYVQEHSGVDRSKIVDAALRLWVAQRLHEELIAQHTGPKSPEELEERRVWKRIRAAQMPYLTGKYDLREG